MSERSETVKLERDRSAEGVVHLVLDKPGANTLDLAMAEDLAEAALALHGDTSVRAVVLRGEGPAFCAGGDLKAFHAQGDALPTYLKKVTVALHVAVAHLTQLDAPVVAAVHGSAAGAGFSLTLGADFVVAGESAKFVMAYTKAGLAPDGGSTWFLVRHLGLRRATDLTLRNSVLGAAEAQVLGVVTKVVPDDAVAAEATALAAELAAGPTRTFGAAKRLLRSSVTNTLETQLELESRAITDASATADGREGIGAFLEKRTPQFTAR
jgi:2-(1,2-epoxy-1,2-dihydrophenyl)acetyl-CoA isomerase